MVFEIIHIIYLILIYTCYFLTISNRFNISNFLKSYFTISIVTTTASFILTNQHDVLILSSLYNSIIVIGSILGIFISHKYYSYFVLMVNLILLALSIKYNLINDSFIMQFIEIAVFISICIYKKCYTQFYFYLFIILLSTTFVNDFWISLLYENKDTPNKLIFRNIYWIFSGIYLITFYIIFIIYHVKFRSRKQLSF